MKWNMSSAVIVAVALSSAAVGAQSAGPMAKSDKMEKMKKMDASYTGCIEPGAGTGAFTLTHLAASERMARNTMKRDGLKDDTMAATKEDTMAKDGMSHDSMAPTALALTGSSADLRKHLGHKVTVVGSLAHEKMDAMKKDTMDKATPTFTVKSVKMVAATCS
jgi:pentapeptide MXKDX repeat protein